MDSSHDHRLPPRFGTATATFVVVSSMVGVGILTTSGRMVATLGSNQLMLIVWILGGLIAFCGALSLAEPASAWSLPGGDYAILRLAYGPTIAFLGGWTTLVVGFAAPIAASSAAAALYLPWPFPMPPGWESLAHRIPASLMIVGFTVLHALGDRSAVKAQGVLTAVEIALVAIFIVFGLVSGHEHSDRLFDLPALGAISGGSFAYALVFVAYAYTGWNGSAFIASEVIDPPRTLPRSIVLGTSIVIALYVGLNVVYALALPASEIVELARVKGDDAVVPIAELAAKRLGGERFGQATGLLVSSILIASVSVYLLTGSRIMYAMACIGQFPRFASRLARRSRTPAPALAALAAASLLLLWTGSFDQVVIYAGVGLTIASMAVVGAVFVLRRRHPDHPRPFRVPGYPVVPAIFLAGSAALLIGVTIEDPLATLSACGCIVLGVPIDWWTRAERRNRESA
ncbi:MAG: amino acid permease [Isosphaeraceae bacterium]|nr:amino acid permease [Isosphaeraceae bacterium]